MRRFGGRLSMGRFCAEDMSVLIFACAFGQNGEIQRASRPGGIAMLYSDYRVVHEVEAAPQKPLWRKEPVSGLHVGSGAVW